jgi:hypothetical protein
MKVVGKTNAGWGVCGITTSMYAMYEMNPAARPWLINAPRAFTVLSEIKGYLRLLQEFGGEKMIKDIETFTRTFGAKFAKFTVNWYIDYINRAGDKYMSQTTGAEDSKIYEDELFSIGLHPEAVADYLKRRCGYASVIATTDPGSDAFIGVQDVKDDNSSKLYNGLCHWVYRKGGKIYSWGKSFNSLAEADANFLGVYFVTVK